MLHHFYGGFLRARTFPGVGKIPTATPTHVRLPLPPCPSLLPTHFLAFLPSPSFPSNAGVTFPQLFFREFGGGFLASHTLLPLSAAANRVTHMEILLLPRIFPGLGVENPPAAREG